ncbi:MAG: cell division protein FtsA [Chitinophagales bacterium]
MGNTNTIVAALDIGTTKICAIVARRTDYGKIEVLGVGKSASEGVRRGVISNIDKTVYAIEEAVEEAKRRSGIDITNVYVGIAGQHIKSQKHRGYLMRNHDEQEIDLNDIERLVTDMYKLRLDPGEQIIHVLPQEFTIDGQPNIKDPIGMSGVRLEADFHVITGQDAAIKNINRCVEKAGLKVAGLILEPLASAEAVLNDEELEAGVALVDIGGGTTDIAIFQEGIIRHTAVIPLGGNIVTEDIKEGCMVMQDQAEKLKVKFGCALVTEAKENAVVSIPGIRGRSPKEISVRNLSHIIQARMEEILEHVYFEIRRSGFENKLIGGIVATGGGARLKFLDFLTEFVSGMDARVGIPSEHLVNPNYRDLNDPIFATAVGLVIMAMENQDPVEATEAVAAAAIAAPDEMLPMDVPVVDETPLERPKDDFQDIYQEETSSKSSGSWWDNLVRKSKEWLEGDMNDYN